MNKLKKAKKIIKEYYNDGDCGIFNTQNTTGDWMTSIYNDKDLAVDICYSWSYFEVFGLSDEEFAELCEYYNQLS